MSDNQKVASNFLKSQPAMEFQKLFILAIVVGCSHLGIGLHAQDCVSTLSGQVTDAETGSPMPFVTILVRETGDGTLTDDEGHYLILGLCDSTYTLVLSHIACSHIEEQVRVTGRTAKDFKLSHIAFSLSGVEVTAEAYHSVPMQKVQTLSGVKLDQVKGQTLTDALLQIAGVSSLNTGSTIGKPVIRGLHSNRILVLNNGVRQEGQQWGVEHAPEIDPFTADKIEVVKGVGGVRYGPEAIGGVILVEPKPLPHHPGFGGEVALVGYSNGRTGVASAMLETMISEKIPVSGRIQGTLKRGGNLRTPDYFLANTGTEEYSFSWDAAWKATAWRLQGFYSRFFNQPGIFAGSHIGNLADLENAIHAERPLVSADFTYDLGNPRQRILHELTKVRFDWKIGLRRNLEFQASRQFNRRQEFDAHRPFGADPSVLNRPASQFELTTYGADLIFRHKSTDYRWNTELGAQAQFQNSTTDFGVLIPDYLTTTLGLFVLEHWHRTGSPLHLEAGLRYDFKQLIAALRQGDDTRQFNNFTGTAGANYELAGGWKFSALLGNAWRGPNVNELYSQGVHHGSASYETGNAQLKSEKALQLEFSAELQRERYHALVSAYYQWISDFIYLRPEGEVILTIRGAFPYFSYQQADARLYGMEAVAGFEIVKNLEVEGKFSAVRARNRDLGTWLPLMPADRAEGSVQYDFKWKSTFVKTTYQYIARQSRAPEGIDLLAPPAGCHLLSLQAGMTLPFGKTSVFIGVSAQNLTNARYRDYLNRFRYYADETGRNISVRAKFSF
jgi:iron complex outermembrane receptor protein